VGPDYTDDIQREKPQSDTNIILSVAVPAEDETCICVCLCVRLYYVGMMGYGEKKRERPHHPHFNVSHFKGVCHPSASFTLTSFLSASE